MVLFKKYYKEANDDIKPNRELIEKIFDQAEKTSKAYSWKRLYKYGMVAAAVLVLAVSVYSYDAIIKLANQEPAIIENNLTEPKIKSVVPENAPKEEKNAQTEAALQKDTPVQNAPAKQIYAQEESSHVPQPAAHFEEDLNKKGRMVVKDVENSIIDVQKLRLPADMTRIESEEEGLNAIEIHYIGENNRSITIKTSKVDGTSIEEQAKAEVFEVGGIDSKIIKKDEQSFNAHLEIKGCIVEVSTHGITYDELKLVLSSVAEQ